MPVISIPLRLSGRRRDAIRPHAANEPPTRVKTTSIPSIGASRSNSTGLSATTSAATTAIQSAIQSHPSGLAKPKRAKAEPPNSPAGSRRIPMAPNG